AESAQPDAGAIPELDLWQRARQRLGEDLAREIEVRAVAGEAGLSVDHFIRGFRRRFAISPGDYRAQQRLRHGAHLLRAGDDPIKSVARAVGFTDAYAFTRAFRRWLGVLPSDLRAGRATLPPDAHPDQPLLPVNRHILPPAAGANHYEQFTPPR
ncbi:MAG: helix-turn-helix transcriptional regulator, partial [Planctomycetes bacterium]|nr:helix-turn-helix transcriptional regulator [Planctomycetota bacterium]